MGAPQVSRLDRLSPIQASHCIEAGGFKVIDSSLHRLWGLPVEIVIAEIKDLPG